MTTFYIKNNQKVEDKIYIFGEDVNHIKNVLRYKINDELYVCDEDETRFFCQIIEFEKDKIVLQIQNVMEETTEPKIEVDLYQGLPKSDKLEWIIQKGTEIGVKKFIPVITDRVIVKLDEKNELKKLERWQKIAKEAATQSGRQMIPIIENTINLQNSIEKLSKYDIVIAPYECEFENSLWHTLKSLDADVRQIAVVIGPEGGFSEHDIEVLKTLKRVQMVSLGKRILRTETAGIVTVSNILYELEGLDL